MSGISLFLALPGQAAAGKSLASQKTATTSASIAISDADPQWSGPYALVEWNPVDLLFWRGRFHAEYVALDGLAFGFSVEYQKKEFQSWNQQTASLGASSTQYFQSLGLKGLFARGEAGMWVAAFREKVRLAGADNLEWKEGRSVGMGFGLDVGYRQPLGRHFVVSSALGGRRIVPDFFLMRQTSQGERYERREGLWQPRLDLALGWAF